MVFIKNNECNVHSKIGGSFRFMLILCFPENKTGSYINFCSKNAVGLILEGCFIFFMFQSLHLFKYSHVIFFWLLHDGGGQGFTSLRLILSVVKNHTRAYFQIKSYFWGNRIDKHSCDYRLKCYNAFRCLEIHLLTSWYFSLSIPLLLHNKHFLKSKFIKPSCN